METTNLRDQLILLIMESELKHFRIEDITDWRIAKIHSVVNKLMNPSDKYVESEKIPLDASVKVIGLPKQFENFLIDVKEIETIGQLLELRMDDFTRMRNFVKAADLYFKDFASMVDDDGSKMDMFEDMEGFSKLFRKWSRLDQEWELKN